MTALLPLRAKQGIVRLFDTEHMPAAGLFVAFGIVLIFNLAMLLAYQHYLAGDFPFQDEWKYVDRLRNLHELGFYKYLFDRVQAYYMPMFLFVWYLSYKLTHLDIMLIRYFGAIISTLVSLLLCVMLFRFAARKNIMTLLLILSGPFIICSYSHWATFSQSIESVEQPLLFGIVLATCWAGNYTLGSRVAIGRILLCSIGEIIGAGIYPPALAVLPAIAVSRSVLLRRVDKTSIFMAVTGAGIAAWYLLSGNGLKMGYAVSKHEIFSLLFWFKSIAPITSAFISLNGIALYSPIITGYNFIRILGAGIIILQIFAIVHVLRLASGRRKQFMIPLTLTLYNLFVFLEIIATRLHYPGMAFTPRYSILMLAGPVSLLFWGVMLIDKSRWNGWRSIGTLAIVIPGVLAADFRILQMLPYFRHFTAYGRAALITLQTQPNYCQIKSMGVSKDLAPLVLSGKKFIEANHLALYRGNGTDMASAVSNRQYIAIKKIGYVHFKENTKFLQPRKTLTIWLRMNHVMVGNEYVNIDGMKIPVKSHGNLITVEIPADVTDQPEKHQIYVMEIVCGAVIESKPVSLNV